MWIKSIDMITCTETVSIRRSSNVFYKLPDTMALLKGKGIPNARSQMSIGFIRKTVTYKVWDKRWSWKKSILYFVVMTLHWIMWLSPPTQDFCEVPGDKASTPPALLMILSRFCINLENATISYLVCVRLWWLSQQNEWLVFPWEYIDVVTALNFLIVINILIILKNTI